MRFLLTASIAFVLVLAGALGMNAAVDPAGLVGGPRRASEAAAALIAGRAIPLSNSDDRQLQRAYAAAVRSAPEVLVVGSSRMMQVTAGVAPGRRVYNASMASLTLEDLLAALLLFCERPDAPATVVIGIDPWLLDEAPRNERWRTLAAEAQGMRALIGAKPLEGATGGEHVLLRLLSLDYLGQSLETLQASWRNRGRPAAGADADFAGGTKNPDGSITYGQAFATRPSPEVLAAAELDARQLVAGALKNRTAAPGSVEILRRGLDRLRRRGIEVVLLLPPFHPRTYALLTAARGGDQVLGIDAVVRRLAEPLGLRVLGGSDPAPSGCGSDEFWDGVHAKTGCLHRLLAPGLRPSAAAGRS